MASRRLARLAASYHGCVNTYTGVLRIISAGEQCQDHELPIQLGGSGSDTALLERIAELEAQIATLEAQVPDCLSTEGIDAFFEGCNVHVRSGAGATDAPVNGLGNLIVGYNEPGAGDMRTGSHNLVVGQRHSYSSYGGLVAGINNTISGISSSVSGGISNTASGDFSSVSGGSDRSAPNDYDWRGGEYLSEE